MKNIFNNKVVFGFPKPTKLIKHLIKIATDSYNDDIVFTSCATESNNWVLKSIFTDHIVNGKKNHIITTEVEHPSILSTCKWLEEEGVKVTYLPVNEQGIVDAKTVKSFITEHNINIKYKGLFGSTLYDKKPNDIDILIYMEEDNNLIILHNSKLLNKMSKDFKNNFNKELHQTVFTKNEEVTYKDFKNKLLDIKEF